jgi:ATP-binding cassette subfamily G (WHITE) protein 2 (PDR)
MFTYLLATEYISAKKSKGEVLVFRRGRKPASLAKTAPNDEEATGDGMHAMMKKYSDDRASNDAANIIQKQTSIFHWQDVCYDIKIKGEPRRILDHVDGWVRPGTLTALMVRGCSTARGICRS